MSIKAAIAAMLLLSATALPALAENYANDPARSDAPTIVQQPLFGGIVGAQPGTTKAAATRSTARQEASADANAVTRTDATTGSSAAAPSTNAHMYDFLSGPEYRGGN
jgi:hypothetical protein